MHHRQLVGIVGQDDVGTGEKSWRDNGGGRTTRKETQATKLNEWLEQNMESRRMVDGGWGKGVGVRIFTGNKTSQQIN